MKFIILGANGMLGHALQDVCAKETLLLWDKDELDITNRAAVHDAFTREKPNVVINAAAYTNVDDCETNHELAMHVNATAVENLAQGCADAGATLVHYSTDYVFDGKNSQGYREDDTPGNPLNFYGSTKLAGENALNIKSGALNFYLIRTSWLYGPHGKNFVDSMVNRVRTGQKEFKVVNDQHGKPTYTVDLALETLKLLNLKRPAGVYHMTNETATAAGISWFDFTKEIFSQAAAFDPQFADIAVAPCASQEFPRPAQRPQYSMLVNTKLPPLRAWQEALREYLTKYVFA